MMLFEGFLVFDIGLAEYLFQDGRQVKKDELINWLIVRSVALNPGSTVAYLKNK